ncbi:unnamed protein product [Arctia plantaginis]|uniref:Peptidase S1 domain-containing protein n=1 Tax=Arctia plantaginis TaxID=874455 RepID=A0A8S1ADU1_ARCPL|nr:unnamed protein product [Arctia plantaginis]
MLKKTAFLLLAVAIVQVSSEYIEPQFIEDVIQEQSRTSLGPRIVSGWDAKLGQHPHQAHMRMTNAAGGVSTCGGCFVHHDWMITAAHCTATRVSLLIRGGMISLSETPEYMSETNEFWNYPSYDNSIPQIVQPNDISIVKLQEPIVYTRNLKPIRIQPSADANRNFGEITLHASGFGATWTGGSGSQVLQWVYLRGVSNLLCGLTFGTTIVTDTTICAQWFNVTSQSICQGDSGGPLVYTYPEGKIFLVGVTSFTAGANSGGCHSGLPAAFIRPGHFHDWYTEVTGIDFENLDEVEDETTTTPPTTLPPTTVPPTTEPPTSLPPTTPEGDSNEEGSDEDDTSEEDEDLPELLKRLQVKVKVKVKVNQFRKKVRVVKKIH